VRAPYGAPYVVADNYSQAYHVEITKSLQCIGMCATGATLECVGAAGVMSEERGLRSGLRMRTVTTKRALLGGLAALLLVVAVAGGALTRPSLRPAPSPALWWTNRAAIGRGARDFATGSCVSCHALTGVSNADAAIDLTYEGRRRAATWLLHEIIHPTSDRPATPPGQERDLAAYLASLH